MKLLRGKLLSVVALSSLFLAVACSTKKENTPKTPGLNGLSKLDIQFTEEKLVSLEERLNTKELLDSSQKIDLVRKDIQSEILSHQKSISTYEEEIANYNEQLLDITANLQKITEKVDTKKSKLSKSHTDSEKALQKLIGVRERIHKNNIEYKNISSLKAEKQAEFSKKNYFQRLKDTNYLSEMSDLQKELVGLNAELMLDKKTESELILKVANLEKMIAEANDLITDIVEKKNLESELKSIEQMLLIRHDLIARANEKLLELEALLLKENENYAYAVDYEQKYHQYQSQKDYNEAKWNLIQKLHNSEAISEEEVINALIAKHQHYYVGGDTENKLYDFNFEKQELRMRATNAGDSLFNFKKNYEYEIEHKLGASSSTISYHSNAVSMFNVLKDYKMQCSSGTMLYLTLNYLRENANKNLVVILTDGHIQPGFVEKSGKDYLLYGVETTAAGKALVRYGTTSFVGGEIIVLDAIQFLLVDILKEEISNLEEIYLQMLDTIKAYAFKPEQFKAVHFSSGKSQEIERLNSHIFSFGKAPELIKPRVEFDEKIELSFFIQKSEGKSGHSNAPGAIHIDSCEQIVQLNQYYNESGHDLKVIMSEHEGHSRPKEMSLREANAICEQKTFAY